jgi:hypothetical protein
VARARDAGRLDRLGMATVAATQDAARHLAAAGSSSTITAQARQTPCPQARRVPVRPSYSCSTSINIMSSGTSSGP